VLKEDLQSPGFIRKWGKGAEGEKEARRRECARGRRLEQGGGRDGGERKLS